MGAKDSAGIFFGLGKRGRMAGKRPGRCGFYAMLTLLAPSLLTAVGLLRRRR